MKIGFFGPLQCILGYLSLWLFVLGSAAPPPPLSFHCLFRAGEISCFIFLDLPLQIQLLDKEQVASQGSVGWPGPRLGGRGRQNQIVTAERTTAGDSHFLVCSWAALSP